MRHVVSLLTPLCNAIPATAQINKSSSRTPHIVDPKDFGKGKGQMSGRSLHVPAVNEGQTAIHIELQRTQ